MHNYNATLVHWHQMRLRFNLKTAYATRMPPWFIDITHWDVSAVVLVLMLLTKWHPSEYWSLKKINYFMTSLRGKIEVEVKIENKMHNYNVTLVHWHHTLGCQCSSFGTYAAHKVAPVRVLIAEKINYFMTSLRGKNGVTRPKMPEEIFQLFYLNTYYLVLLLQMWC